MRKCYFELVFGVGVVSLAGAFVLACGSDGGGTTTSSGTGDDCGPGTVLCGGTCTVTALDPNHCGQCGTACASGESCNNGMCVVQCSGGTTSCGGSCVDTQSNATHCGQCDQACDSLQVCMAGSCASACLGGTTQCGQACVDTDVDPSHCGQCDQACNTAQEVCSAGQCMPACVGSNLTQCGSSCVDTTTDTMNCGQCGQACTGAEKCIASQCVVEQPPKGVYTMTNDPGGNTILAYTRAADGSLSPSGTFTATGGRGTGAGLGNQRGLIFDPMQNLFFVVNAGDDSISMLSLRSDGTLELLSNVNSGGVRPVSITVFGSVVYVLNAGVATSMAPGNITGFRIMGNTLTPIANSTQPLSAPNTNPAQIQFSPDGTVLAVTERATNTLATYTVASDIASAPIVTTSAGQTPFGFDFSANGQLVVSEAWGGQMGLSSASSYTVGANGMLTTVTGAIPTTRTAACWLVVAGNYAYMANAATDDITGFSIAADGTLTMLDANGVTGQAGDAPIDEDVTDGNDFLYVLNNASDSFSIFQINADGSLTKKPDFVGLPSTAAGIVAW